MKGNNMLQYRVIENKTGKVIGYIIGKTPNRELVVQCGNKVKVIKITPRTEIKYRVEVLEMSA